jgi:two-component system response regulator YesN
VIKIFLVEDEIVVRNGIKNKIDWESAGFSMVGDASDGEIAYPLILETKPDIIITDIKMPFIDGLTLSQMVREVMPWIKIIILSGYNEFEFAQEAIQIGITDFLVKPVIKEKLMEIVKKAAAEVVAEREQKALMEQYKKDMEEIYFLKRQQFFSTLLSGNEPVSDMLKKGRDVGIDIMARAYIVLSFSTRRKDESDEAFHESSVRIQDKVVALTENKSDIIFFNRSLTGWHFLIKGKDEADAIRVLEEYIQALIEIVSHFDRLHYFAGVGSTVTRIGEIATSFNEAIKAHSYRYILEPNQVIYARQIEEQGIIGMSRGSDNCSTLHPERMNRIAIDSYLKTGSRDEVEAFFDDYCINVGEDCLRSELIRQYISLDVFCSCELFLRYLECADQKITEICGSFHDLESHARDPERARQYLCLMMSASVDFRDLTSKRKYDPLLVKARRYMEQNYGSMDLSLNTVAAHVNISASHFSTIFSQETGQTFTEYLTEIRIKNAKQLLKCTQKPSGEIGYLIGYKDAHYFSYIFKKITGQTPSEYRTGKRSDPAK